MRAAAAAAAFGEVGNSNESARFSRRLLLLMLLAVRNWFGVPDVTVGDRGAIVLDRSGMPSSSIDVSRTVGFGTVDVGVVVLEDGEWRFVFC